MQNGAAVVEDSLAVTQRVKYRVTPRPSNSTLGCLPKRNEDMGLHENLHTNVRQSSQKVKNNFYTSNNCFKKSQETY